MEQDLRNAFERLKLCTLECINSLQNDNYDYFNELITKRQEILDSISCLNSLKENFSDLVNELDILLMEKMLIDSIQVKKIELRDKIDNIGKNKIATNSYNKGTLKSATIFSKKI